MSNKKRIVTEVLKQVSLYELEGSLNFWDEIIQEVRTRAVEHSLTNVQVEVDKRYRDYEDQVTIEVIFKGDRLETDLEQTQRLAREAKFQEIRKEEELKQFEALKKKYNL